MWQKATVNKIKIAKIHVKTANILKRWCLYVRFFFTYLFACWVILHAFLSSVDLFFSKIHFFKKKSFRNTIRVSKEFGSRSGPTFCRAWSGSKLFAKVISRWQKSPIVGKELMARQPCGSFSVVSHNKGEKIDSLCFCTDINSWKCWICDESWKIWQNVVYP